MKTIWNLPLVHLQPFESIQEQRPALIITSMPAWNAVHSQLHLPVSAIIDIRTADQSHWDREIRQPTLEAQVIYAVGGGLAADAGKYAAAQLNLPLVCLPTALSVDAFFTSASGIRRDGCVTYIETTCPGTVILDFEIIAAAPESVRAAGITDVLSIATGSWDWKHAESLSQNPPGMAFIPWVHDNALSILEGALDCAEAAGAGDPDGLQTLYHCLALEVQLCNQIGHARPEEGSEHYFAYSVENHLEKGLSHGELVGPGILLAARWQGQDTSRLEQALRACHIPLDRIPGPVVDQTLAELAGYVHRHKLPFGIFHEKPD